MSTRTEAPASSAAKDGQNGSEAPEQRPVADVEKEDRQPPHGPKKRVVPPRTKIAIVGKAPSSRMLAPYDKPDNWEIWSISDNYNVISRWDRWFEIHDLQRYRDLYPEYYDWMAELPGGDRPLYTTDEIDFPAAVRFPWQDIVARFGQYFTNSISWLQCFAILEIEAAVTKRLGRPPRGPKDYENTGAAIGLWGVDMATHSEYEHQRPSCEFFLGWAQGMGIKVVVPDECDLLKTARLYAVQGFRGELDIKLRVRAHELEKRKQDFETRYAECQTAANCSNGAVVALESLLKAGGLDQQLAEAIKTKVKQLEAEHTEANKQLQINRSHADMVKGALEDIQWTKQWA